MVKKGYWRLALPENLISEVRVIVESEDSIYTNPTDFIKQAVREKVERIRSQRMGEV